MLVIVSVIGPANPVFGVSPSSSTVSHVQPPFTKPLNTLKMLRSLSLRALRVPSPRSFDLQCRASYSTSNSPITSSQRYTLPHIPELYDPNFLDALLPPNSSTLEPKTAHLSSTNSNSGDNGPRNAMVDALETTTHRAFTQNLAPAFSSTLSPTLDAFNALNKYCYNKELNDSLTRAWKEDAGLTLRLIWQLRSIHEGKSERNAFYRAFGWLYENHPRTAILNLHMLVAGVCPNKTQPELRRSHGYWKDLLNILGLATTAEFPAHRPTFLYPLRTPRKGADLVNAGRETLDPVEASKYRARMAEMRYGNLHRKLEDKKFRALYVAVARLLSEKLLEDLRVLEEIEGTDLTPDRLHELVRQISLVGKWAPSPGASHDRHTNIGSAIALLIHHRRSEIPSFTFPSALESSPASTLSTDRPGLTILRSYFCRWILRRLREITHVTEPLMSSNKWTSIRYHRVPSRCMNRNMAHFFRHDPDGFEKYLLDVESGKKQISGATLLPDELASKAIKLGWAIQQAETPGKTQLEDKLRQIRAQLAPTQLRVVEAQWEAMIERLRESGSLENSMAICDVSGSMGYLHDGRGPLVTALALSLILKRLAKPPFDRGFITFSENPKFVKVQEGKGLYDTFLAMSAVGDWGYNTDFEKVFLGLILPLAVKHKVPRDQMVKRLFVFSDMQFDEARTRAHEVSGSQNWAEVNHAGEWKTNYDVVKAHFERAGYDMPEIVYWDLGNYGTVEVDGEREGVAIMNGSSPNLLKVFMGEEADAEGEVPSQKEKIKEVFNPINVMKKAVMKECFDGLVVVD
ncbi:hypothetical protein PQX77_000455 [Marasmius sp. AFHP31]|nr:hypothetical protein PQX77_000455 [Marasmius sp. AFHP31]